MPITTGPQIDMNQIHVEAGGGSGAQCSLNDTDIRDLIGKGSGVQMAMTEWYGASAAYEMTITNHLNPGGGSPGALTGYAALGALKGPGSSPGADNGGGSRSGDGLGAIPDSNGVTWELALLGREQGFGNIQFRVGFRDTTIAEDKDGGSSPNYEIAWPAGDITLATDAAFTQNVVVIPGSGLAIFGTSVLLTGCQMAWQYTRTTSDTNPSLAEVDAALTTGSPAATYVKIEKA